MAEKSFNLFSSKLEQKISAGSSNAKSDLVSSVSTSISEHNSGNPSITSLTSFRSTDVESRDESLGLKRSRRKRHDSHSPSASYESDSDDEYSRSKRSKKKHRHSSRLYKSRSTRDRSRSTPRDRKKRSERRDERKEHSPSPRMISYDSKRYIIDRRGDPDIFTYGLNKYNIPLYHRAGAGRVLGLSNQLRIDQESSKGNEGIVIRSSSNKKTVRYTDKRYGIRDDKDIIRFDFEANRSSFNWNQTYISLDDGNVSKDEDEYYDVPDYRDIERKKERDIKSKENVQVDKKEGLTYEEHIRQKTKNLSLHLEKEPHNISLWLKFIEFQNESMQIGKKVSGSSTRASINEIKISIFEKALEKNPNSQELLLGLLKCCEETWDPPRLLTKWDQVLKDNPRAIKLWMQYLNFRQTNLASFAFAQCVEVFEECLDVLREAASSENLDDLEQTEETMVHVFIRLCHFLIQSGYSERAYACLQGIMEMNFFLPEMLKGQSYEERLSRFGEFWETEFPRFGEKGAKGWMYYTSQEGMNNDNDEDNTSFHEGIISPDEAEDGYHNWLMAETELEKTQTLPLHSDSKNENLEVEDPFRIVLFDDIQNFIFNLTSPKARNNLIYACFNFLGLPFNPCRSSRHPLVTDAFLHPILTNDSLANSNFWPPSENSALTLINNIHGVLMESETRSGDNNVFKFPLKTFPQENDNIFKSDNWFSICEESMLTDFNITFAKNAFIQLRKVLNDTGLDLCYLVLENLISNKKGRKLAKELLKTDRMNLILWNGYAQLEKSRNNISEARRVYITALSMYRSFPEQYQLYASLLHRMFAEMEWEQGRPNTALNILIMLTEEKSSFDSIPEQDMPPPSPTRLLKARKYYAQKISQMSTLAASQADARNVIHLCVCFSLLEYLGQNLGEACKIYETMLAELILEKALTIFPDNSEFLSLYFFNELRTKIQNRVRRFLDAALVKKPSHVLWTFAIFAELHLQKAYNQHHIRALFERALECPTTRHSVSIWNLYIDFEIKHNQQDRAKALYFRAIRECPWSKDIYLLAFRRLRSHFSTEELEEVMNLMLEKEIRLRIPFEKYVDDDDKNYELMDVNIPSMI
ncbi:4305_t:CDS:10 [Ambispora gerdemannii]|uniref:4305_t:CDS:1 n=1 Tax=Ambispora gerdemannii TaxID=144530 RepID=A0A9N9FQ91_9GLOM|nr:4305_t:CDS:10 [Ambispora gerdemannii]